MVTLKISLSKMAWFVIVFWIIWLFQPIDCSTPISEEKADQIAKAKLEEYCKNEGILGTRFAKPNISSDKKHLWIYEYVSRESPKHNLLIYIDRYGKTELHRMIE